MSLQATFYHFNKRPNSTVQPGTTVPGMYTFYINLKDGCSITHPIIDLNWSSAPAGASPSWNYCYIPNFNRYYFITSWYWDLGRWTASMDVDVLASYKTEIGSTGMYCLRSAAEFDTYITDTFYPIKNSYTRTRNEGFLVTNFSTGRYIVGVVGAVAAGSALGGITYMQLTATQFNELKNKLFADDLAYAYHGSNAYDSGLTSMGQSLAKLVFQPFQYIVSCCWVPAAAPVAATVTSWRIGFWEFSATGGIQLVNPTDCIVADSINIAIPKRNSARGKYLECSPYTELQIFLPTVGLVSLDTEKLVDITQLNVAYYADPVSQKSFILLGIRGTDNKMVTIGTYPAGFAVPITLAQSGATLTGAAVGGLTAAAGLMSVGAGAIGAGAAALDMAKGAVSSAKGLFAPNVQAIGDDGSFSQLALPVQLTGYFYDVTEADNVHFGRPLCKQRTPSAIPGFMQMLHGEVRPESATKEETEEINRYMENGFYYG